MRTTDGAFVAGRCHGLELSEGTPLAHTFVQIHPCTAVREHRAPPCCAACRCVAVALRCRGAVGIRTHRAAEQWGSVKA